MEIFKRLKPKSEELVYFLSFMAYALAKPTWRTMTDSSYEAWVYEFQWKRQLDALKKKKLIELEKSTRDLRTNSRIVRLTEAGHTHALGGRDPEARWDRAWDGKWRVVLFDVPMEKKQLRNKLRRSLRARAFGCLQQSVWITPDPLDEETKIFQQAETDTKSLLTLEARPATGESDEEIVLQAWDFEEINRRYSKVLEIIEQRPEQQLDTESAAGKFRKWAGQERAAWFAVMEKDPLLPANLLPPGYLGRKAWQARVKAMRLAHERINGFEIGSWRK